MSTIWYPFSWDGPFYPVPWGTQGVASDSDHIRPTPPFWQTLKSLTSFLNRVRSSPIRVFLHSLNRFKGQVHPLLKCWMSCPWQHTHPELWEVFSGRPRSADHWVWCNISCVLESNQHQHFKRSEDGQHAASYCKKYFLRSTVGKKSTHL